MSRLTEGEEHKKNLEWARRLLAMPPDIAAATLAQVMTDSDRAADTAALTQAAMSRSDGNGRPRGVTLFALFFLGFVFGALVTSWGS